MFPPWDKLVLSYHAVQFVSNPSVHSCDRRRLLLADPDWIKLWLSQIIFGNRYQSITFGDLCDVSVCNADVRDSFQVNKSTGFDSCTLQRVGPELWKKMNEKQFWAQKKGKERERTSVTDHVYEVNPPSGVLREHWAESWVNKVLSKRMACVCNTAILHARFPDSSRIILLLSLHFKVIETTLWSSVEQWQNDTFLICGTGSFTS